jgi:transcriptional regulator with XRE-family HTH domain
MFREWVARGLEKEGKDQNGLAAALGVDRTAVSKLIAGKRQLKAEEIEKIAAYLEEAPPTRMMEVRYMIGAGQECIAVDQESPIDYEPVSGMWGVQAELAVVRGDSMKPVFSDGTKLFFGPARTPRPTDHNHMRIVKLADDRMLVKVMKRTADPALWTLESFNFPAIEDVAVLAVAEIIRIEPRG